MSDDEAFATEFDILAKRAIDKAAADYMATNAKKLALHQRLVYALEDCCHWLQACNAWDHLDHVTTLLGEARKLEAK